MIVSHIQNLIQNNSSDEESFPEGWATARLEDICTSPQYGWTTSADRNRTDLKLLRTTDISSGIVDWSTVPGCAKEPNDSEKYLLEPGDIVISRAGSVGLSYLVKECPRAIFASYLIRFRPKPPIESEFIALFLKSQQYWAAIADETIGIAIPNVNASKLRKIEIPLPPLAEQKRVVAKVEELLARVNATRERLTKVKEILKRFRQSVLAAACSGRLTADWRERQGLPTATSYVLEQAINKLEAEYEASCRQTKAQGKRKPFKPTCLEDFELAWELNFDGLPENWTYVPMGKVCLKITDGTHDTPKPTETGIPFITAKHVRDRSVDFENALYLTKEIHDSIYARCNPRRGDVIVVNIGAGTATPAFVNVEFEFSMKNVALLKPNMEILDGRYLELHQLYIKPFVFELVTRGGAQPFMGLNLIKTIPCIMPPLDEQKEVVRHAEAIFKLADQIEKRVVDATARAEKLTQAILAKAFRGELVPTEAELARHEGRSYEPAPVLLERIRIAREEGRPRTKKREKKEK
jgi:type I restriction enzyme S subunit